MYNIGELLLLLICMRTLLSFKVIFNFTDSFSIPYYKSLESQGDWPLMSYYKPVVGYPARGKRYPGVVNECCDKACSINELMTYC